MSPPLILTQAQGAFRGFQLRHVQRRHALETGESAESELHRALRSERLRRLRKCRRPPLTPDATPAYTITSWVGTVVYVTSGFTFIGFAFLAFVVGRWREQLRARTDTSAPLLSRATLCSTPAKLQVLLFLMGLFAELYSFSTIYVLLVPGVTVQQCTVASVVSQVAYGCLYWLDFCFLLQRAAISNQMERKPSLALRAGWAVCVLGTVVLWPIFIIWSAIDTYGLVVAGYCFNA